MKRENIVSPKWYVYQNCLSWGKYLRLVEKTLLELTHISTAKSSFLLMCTLEISGNGSSHWIHNIQWETRMEFLAAGFDLAPTIEGIWGNQSLKRKPLSLSPSFSVRLYAFLIKKNVWLEYNHEETPEKSNTMDILQNDWPIIFKMLRGWKSRKNEELFQTKRIKKTW